MERKTRWIRAVIAALVVVGACQAAPPAEPDSAVTVEKQDAPEEKPDAPSRIILFVGDGMSVPAVTAASYVSGAPLAMTQLDHHGLMTTHSREFVTTDSAASATAMATGEKTHFDGVSVVAGTDGDEEEQESRRLRNIAQATADADWKTGLVATVRINHATPAPFAAHRHHRREYEAIADDMSRSGVDVLLGAGYRYFRDREDDRDLLREMEDRGYVVAQKADEVRTAAKSADRLVGLMHERDMPWADEESRAMELDEMVDRAIEVLDRENPEGFFLMVEGAKIDWAGHRMDGRRVISETIDMDAAVERAVEYSEDRQDTLVVVTSDHDTGAMDVFDSTSVADEIEGLGGWEEVNHETHPDALGESERSELAGPVDRIAVDGGTGFGPGTEDGFDVVTSFGFMSAASRADWDGAGRFSATHTPEMVPIFARGAGAQEIAAVRDNADFGRRLMAWIDGEEPELAAMTRTADDAPPQRPENVVVVVADGWGTAALTASAYHNGLSPVLEMPRMGFVATHGGDRLVNDAAGAATAIATGRRTHRKAVGMAPGDTGAELHAVDSAFAEAVEGELSTGLVSWRSPAGPISAAFYAQMGRYDIGEAVDQFVDLHRGDSNKAIDVVAAHTRGEFEQRHRDELEKMGVEVHDSWTEQPTGGPDHYLVEAATGDEQVPTVDEMTERTIEELSTGDGGFFLVVDAGRIGSRLRSLRRDESLMDALREFDATVQEVLEFARQDGETLVVVTSPRDHQLSVLDNHYGFHRGNCRAVAECGGEFELQWFDVDGDGVFYGEGFSDRRLQGEYVPPRIAVQYGWPVLQTKDLVEGSASHTANFTPLFAEGPRSAAFGGFVEQPQLGRWLSEWVGTEGAVRGD